MRTNEIRLSAPGGAAVGALAPSFHAPAPVMGHVKRVSPTSSAVATREDESRFLRVSDLERWALHTFGAAGDGPQQTAGFGARPVRETIDALADWARQSWRAWEASRRARATAAALSQLDRGTLRDIGITESEALSLALEVEGRIEATRERALRQLSELPHQS